MPVKHLFSYLVPPRPQDDEVQDVLGTEVPAGNKLMQMMGRLFDDAPRECDTEIIFRPTPDGTQANDCRTEFIRHLRGASVGTGRTVATRLRDATTHRSGLGLLFLASGSTGSGPRLVVARFPADQGVIAHERRHALDVEFVERIFMKNAKAYKCVFYEGSLQEMWRGRAVDNQANGAKELSDYWIRDFLLSELETTASSGTRRLAVAMREAIKSADGELRSELLSAAQLVRGKDGRRSSPAELASQLGLSDGAVDLLRTALRRPELMETKFQFDRSEFDRHIAYRSVRLDNGGTLIGQSERFDEIFQREELAGDSGVRYTTQGHVVREELRKTL